MNVSNLRENDKEIINERKGKNMEIDTEDPKDRVRIPGEGESTIPASIYGLFSKSWALC